MTTDQILILIALSAYIMATLALLTYFLSREPFARMVGIPFAFLGCITQFVELLLRWQTTHIWPLTNLYGSLSLFSAMSVAFFIGFALRYDLWFLGGFVTALAGGFLGYALSWNEGYLPPVPALQSYWIKIHVPLVVSSYAAFMVAAVASVVYLIKYYFEQSLEGGAPMAGLSAAGAAAGAGNLGLRMQAEATGDLASLRESPATRGRRGPRQRAGAVARHAAVARQARRGHLPGDGGRRRPARRRHRDRRDVGQGGVGRLLAVGPKGDRRARVLDPLPGVHALALAPRLAGRAYVVGQRRGIPVDHVLLPRRQHLDQRPALVQDVGPASPRRRVGMEIRGRPETGSGRRARAPRSIPSCARRLAPFRLQY